MLANLSSVIDSQLQFTTLLIPHHVANNHWVLLHMDLLSRTFFPINPYRPTAPHQGDIERSTQVVGSIAKAFGFAELQLFMPEKVCSFPRQKVSDTINCGLFVALYTLAFLEQEEPLHFLSINEYRFLFAIWLLTETQPSLKK
jgi:hypothetical protein